ncbi:MAG TPA: DUF1697 domain-containing protein [Microlunatus sp.]|nr:DUF1697 domain-containing protein [Microlunatus sp.]
MRTYAAFLRGINLGPAKKVPMAELRALAEQLGYADVATYINSGNLVFSATAKPARLEQQLSTALRERFGFSVDVCVRSRERLAGLLAANPFPEGDPSKVTIAFLTKAVAPGVEERLAAKAAPDEPFAVLESEIWVHYGRGLGTSELAAKFPAVVGVSATVRNVRTVEKVFGLMS